MVTFFKPDLSDIEEKIFYMLGNYTDMQAKAMKAKDYLWSSLSHKAIAEKVINESLEALKSWNPPKKCVKKFDYRFR